MYIQSGGKRQTAVCASSAQRAEACDFQQCGILTCVDTDKPVQPPFKLSHSKCCLVSSLKVIEYSSDEQRL